MSLNNFERTEQALDRASRIERASWPHVIETYQGNRETTVERWGGFILAAIIVTLTLLAVVLIGH